MARKGRKRKQDAQRYPNGQIKKEKVTVNSKVLELRMKLAKDIAADQSDPLSILFFRGFLKTADEDQSCAENRHDAGANLAALYRRIYGNPHGRVFDPTKVPGEEHTDGVSALIDETRFTRAIRALDRLGRNSRRIVLDCCVHCHFPREDYWPRIRAGLQAVYECERPRFSEAQLDKARAEMAAGSVSV